MHAVPNTEAFELAGRRLWQCKACGYQIGYGWNDSAPNPNASHPLVLGGVPGHHAHTGFWALQLQRQLGLDSYETAWAMLHKLRRAMVRPDREAFQGEG